MNRNQLLIELDKRGVKLSLNNERLIIEAPKGVLTPELRDSIKEHKPEIMGLLRQTETKTNFLAIIQPDRSRQYEPFPLTDIQQAHWLGRSSVFELGNVANHHYIEFEVINLDLSRLLCAWQKLIDRHDMLRAVVLPTGEQQVLEKVLSSEIPILDLRGLEKTEVDTQLEALRQKLSHQVLPSQQWPWFHIRATYLDEQRVRLHINMDLLVVDAASIRILFQEWHQLYQKPDLLLPPLELSFRDYVIHTNAEKNSELIKRSALRSSASLSQDYWFNRLDTLPPAPELPLAYLPRELKEYKFKRRLAKLEPHIWQQLKQRGKQAGLTPSVLLLAAFAEVLTLWSKNPRFTLNLTVLDRLPLHPQIHQIVGDFTNTNLLAIDNSSPNSFTVRAGQIQQQLLQDLDHLHISGVQVLRELARRQKTRGTAAMPIVFSSVLGLNSFTNEDLEFNFLGEVIYGISQTPQVSLDHQVAEQNGALVFNWDAVEELFPEGLLDDMFAAYCNLLEKLATSDSAWVEMPRQLLPLAQLQKRSEVNHTSAPVSPQTLHGLFIERVKVQPESLAVIATECQLTYQELYQRAAELAHQLRQLGASPNSLVAVVMEKGWEQVVSVLGILISGAAYLPVDPSQPQERQWYLLQQGEANLVVTQSHLDRHLSWPENVQRLCVDEELWESNSSGYFSTSLSDSDPPQPPLTRGENSVKVPLFKGDLGGSEGWTTSPSPLKSVQTSNDLAYVIYTSGSTGLPKGVAIDHRGAVNTILDINQRFNVNADDRVLALSSLSFDLSVYDIFGTLAAGGTLIIPEVASTKDPDRWTQLIVKHQVTIWNSVPALMQMLVEYAESHPEMEFNSLRLVLLSGDWIPLNLPDQIRALSQRVKAIALGGATEASIWSILYPIEEVNPTWKSIPYGRPMANQQFYVLNEALQICPIWVPGQLYIAGIGLAKGYWRNPEKTDTSFIIHPQTKERLYKTGDLGRYLPDGNIEFLGREDFQVKVNGYRVELGEIEAALKQHPAIKEAIVTTEKEERGNKILIAYFLPKNQTATPNDLRFFLQQKLPEYMIPSSFILLETLPLTPNGKLNRQALPARDRTKPNLEKTFVPPRNSLEELLTATWTEVFQLQQIGIHDGFFELGGHSFLALQLISKINQKLGTNISLGMLFQYPTVAEIANFILKNTDVSVKPTYLVPIQGQGTQPPLFCIHPIGGQVMVYQHLAACLGLEQPVFALQSRALNDPVQEHNTINDMAVEYAKAIRQQQPNGSYYLMGWSMGGVIAVSVAKQLEQQGQNVAFVGLVDAFLIPENTVNIERDPFWEIASVFGGTFVDAFINLEADKQQSLREELLDLPPLKRLQRMIMWGQEQSLLSTDISAEILQKQVNLIEIHDRLLRVHRTPQIEANLHIWWASDRLERRFSPTDWSQYTTGAIYTKILDGNHFTIIRPPYIKTLARQLQKSLKVEG